MNERSRLGLVDTLLAWWSFLVGGWVVEVGGSW